MAGGEGCRFFGLESKTEGGEAWGLVTTAGLGAGTVGGRGSALGEWPGLRPPAAVGMGEGAPEPAIWMGRAGEGEGAGLVLEMGEGGIAEAGRLNAGLEVRGGEGGLGRRPELLPLAE